jgi:hypothetical protein
VFTKQNSCQVSGEDLQKLLNDAMRHRALFLSISANGAKQGGHRTSVGQNIRQRASSETAMPIEQADHGLLGAAEILSGGWLAQ